jgi:hypothetical protein
MSFKFKQEKGERETPKQEDERNERTEPCCKS